MKIFFVELIAFSLISFFSYSTKITYSCKNDDTTMEISYNNKRVRTTFLYINQETEIRFPQEDVSMEFNNDISHERFSALITLNNHPHYSSIFCSLEKPSWQEERCMPQYDKYGMPQVLPHFCNDYEILKKSVELTFINKEKQSSFSLQFECEMIF